MTIFRNIKLIIHSFLYFSIACFYWFKINSLYNAIKTIKNTTTQLIMYGNDPKDKQVWQGKRMLQLDDEGPVSKKAQRNKWKKDKKNLNQEIEVLNYKEQVNQNLKKNTITKFQKQQMMIEDIKKIVGSDYDTKLIKKYLQKANYDQQTALNYIFQQDKTNQDMMDVFDDKPAKKNIQNVKQSQKKNKKEQKNMKNKAQKQIDNKVEEEANKIFNQIFDKSDIQITGFEFQQLFNQITQIIKQDQKNRGKGVIQINNLVETCMTAKQTILVGLKDVFRHSDEMQINQNDPIYVQLQQYIYDLTQKQIKQEVIKAQQFPTLGQNKKKKNNNNNRPKSPHKISIVNQIQHQSRNSTGFVSANDFFVPKNNKPIVFQQKNSIFNVDNQQQSQDALRGLHKEYPYVSIQTLKIVYLFLQKQYNLCRTFLDQYYGKQKQQTVISIESSPSRKIKKQAAKIHFLSTFRRQSAQQIDEQLLKWTLGQLRDQIEHLYGLRQVFIMTYQKINNSNQRKQLMRIADEKAPLSLIRKLSKAARVKLIQQTIKTNPNYVDLHGYRQQQIGPVIEGLIASLKQQFDRGNQKVKFRTYAGKTEAILQVMTGKGRHSQYGKSVLKPCVKQWASNHNFRTIINEDNVEIFIPLL